MSQVAMMLTDDPVVLEFTSSQRYIDPDSIYKKGTGISFIYTSDHQLYYDTNRVAHYDLIENSPALLKRYGYSEENEAEWENSGWDESAAALHKALGFNESMMSEAWPRKFANVNERDIAMSFGDLVGRTMTPKIYDDEDPSPTICSFWNTDKRVYDQLLASCLSRLIADDHLKETDLVSTPIHETIPISMVATTETSEIDDDAKEKVDLQRRLHLMRGQEKHDAMKRLGVGGSPRHRNIDPGLKWWAPTSEDIVSVVASLLTDDVDFVGYHRN